MEKQIPDRTKTIIGQHIRSDANFMKNPLKTEGFLMLFDFASAATKIEAANFGP
jgi:hypothetical protein